MLNGIPAKQSARLAESSSFHYLWRQMRVTVFPFLVVEWVAEPILQDLIVRHDGDGRPDLHIVKRALRFRPSCIRPMHLINEIQDVDIDLLDEATSLR